VDDLFPIPVYAAMLAATLVGQFLGIAVDAIVFRGHALWLPLTCSLVLEAAVGAHYGAIRLGHPLTARERGRISATYSLGLVVLSLPLASWLAVSGHLPLPRVSASAHGVAVAVVLAVSMALVYTALRYVLMGLFGRRLPKSRPGSGGAGDLPSRSRQAQDHLS
jgi:hypothetical protein